MRTKGSTIRLPQRTLPPARPLSPVQERAQKLAQQVIQTYPSRPAVDESMRFLREHSSCEIVEESGNILIDVGVHSPWLRELPQGYGVKGGAAREEIIAALGLRESREPRDLDLVRRGQHAIPDDDVVAKAFMGRDYSHGARVELVRDMTTHLATRDLTINEVVAIDGKIHASLLCLLDSFGYVIRPSKYRGGSPVRRPKRVQALFGFTGLSLVKMIRLHAEGCYGGENWCLTGIPDEVTVSDFDLALHLNKAFQRGRGVVLEFLRTCETFSLVNPSEDPIRAALDELEHLRHGERGLFPDVPDEEWLR